MTEILLAILAVTIALGGWIILREESARIDAHIARALRDLDLNDEDER